MVKFSYISHPCSQNRTTYQTTSCNLSHVSNVILKNLLNQLLLDRQTVIVGAHGHESRTVRSAAVGSMNGQICCCWIHEQSDLLLFSGSIIDLGLVLITSSPMHKFQELDYSLCLEYNYVKNRPPHTHVIGWLSAHAAYTLP